MGYDHIVAAVKKRQSSLLFGAYYERVNRLAYFCDAVKRAREDQRKEAVSRVYYNLGSIRELSLPTPQEQHHTFFELLHHVHEEVLLNEKGDLVNFNEEDVGGLSDAIRQVFPELPFAWSHLHEMPLFPSSSQHIVGYDAHKTDRYILSAEPPPSKILFRRKGHQENPFSHWYDLLFKADQIIAIGEAGHDFGDYFGESQSPRHEIQNRQIQAVCSEDRRIIAQEITFDLISEELEKSIRLFYLSMPDDKNIIEDKLLLKSLERFLSYNDSAPILVHSGYRGVRASEMVLFLKACEYLKCHPLNNEQDEKAFVDWFHIETLTLRSLRFACENQAGVLAALQGALVVYQQHYHVKRHAEKTESSYACMMSALGEPAGISKAQEKPNEANQIPAVVQVAQPVGKAPPSPLPFSALLRTRSCSPFCDPSPERSPCSPVSVC